VYDIRHIMSLKFSIRTLKKTNGPDANNVFVKKNGVSLKKESGCTVILIHGFSGTPYEMAGLAKSLYRNGYSAICPILANHGKPMNILKRTKWQDCYETVRKVFLDVKSKNKEEIVFAAGLSIGTLLALLLAEEFKDEITGISCLSPTLFYDGWNMPWTKHLLPLAYYTPLRNFFYFKEDPPYGIKNKRIRNRIHDYYKDATLEDMEGIIQYGYPYIPATLLNQHHLLVKHVKKKLSHINVPIQLIQAKEDETASVKNSQFIYDRINSEIKEMIILNDSYHVITADQERDKVASEVQRFFNRIKNKKIIPR